MYFHNHENWQKSLEAIQMKAQNYKLNFQTELCSKIIETPPLWMFWNLIQEVIAHRVVVFAFQTKKLL